MTAGLSPCSPIERYLDELAASLRVDPRRARRILAETEDHLREAAQGIAGERAPREQEEQQAVVAFGAPRLVARRFAAEEGRLLPPSLLLNLVLALALLAGVGLAAIGASGAVSAGFGAAFGTRFVSGDIAGVTYTPARCKELMEYAPGATDCEAAATLDHFDEVVSYRLAAGVLGLLVLGGYLAVRRRYPRGSGVRLLPEAFSPIVGSALFGVAAAGLLLQGLGMLAFDGGSGAGAYLSGGIVAGIVFAWYGTLLLNRLRADLAPH